MTPLRPLIEQRIIDQVPDFDEVRGAASIAQMIERGNMPYIDKGCYVFQDRVQAATSESPYAPARRVSPQFAIVVTVRNVRDASGVDAADIAADLLGRIRAALQGWAPEPQSKPMEYTGGALISFENGFLTWKDTYKTDQYILNSEA